MRKLKIKKNEKARRRLVANLPPPPFSFFLYFLFFFLVFNVILPFLETCSKSMCLFEDKHGRYKQQHNKSIDD